MSHRIEKINDLVRDSIAEILVKHLSLKKGVFVSVIKVDTSKDLRYARVLVSVFPEDQQTYVSATLKKELFSIQSQLNYRIHSKIVPKIEFVIDNTQHNIDKIENIFKQIHEEHKDG